MIKAVVLGSLTTYEICRLLPANRFEVVLYVPQTRVISLLGSGIESISGSRFENDDPNNEILSWDVNKDLVKAIRNIQPDLLVIDLIEERYDIVQWRSQYYTKTDSLVQSGLLQNDMADHSILNYQEELEAYKTSAHELTKLLFSLAKHIVFHRAFCAERRQLGEIIEPLSDISLMRARALNKRLGGLYDLIATGFQEAIKIESSPAEALADGERYGGSIPYIYSPSYKAKVADKIAALKELKWTEFTVWGKIINLASKTSTAQPDAQKFHDLCKKHKVEFYPGDESTVESPYHLNIRHCLVRYERNRYLYYVYRLRPGRPLVIVFSGVDANPGYNRLNYYKFMYNLDASVLFIPDPTGEHGCYYNMVNGSHDIVHANLAIAAKVILETGLSPTEVYFIGSSKGGSASILYSLLLGGGTAIAGEPQILLGDYLFGYKAPQFNSIIYTMTGRVDDEDRKYLNSIFPEVVESVSEDYSGKIKIMVGDCTGYLGNHVEPFMGVTKNTKIVDKVELLMIELDNHGLINIKFTEYIYNLFGTFTY